MKRTISIFLALFAFAAFLSVGVSAQVTTTNDASNEANLDIRFTDQSTGQQMPLTFDISRFPVLRVYDNQITEKRNDDNTVIDIEKATFSKKELAQIFQVKPKQVKAYIILKGNHATSIYGVRGVNGVLQVLSPQKYRQLKKEGKLDPRYKVAKNAVDGKELKQESRAISPKDRGLVTNEYYLAQLLEYAPECLVCGYIMRNAERKNLWGIFLVKEKKKYYLVYKEEDKVHKRKIKSDLAAILEASANTQISKIEFDINNPVFTEVYGGSLEFGMVYDGDMVFAVTPSKAAHFRAWNGQQYNGINDEYWQAEVGQFKQK